MRKVRLPLSGEVKRYLSSGQYSATVQQALGYADLPLTFLFRYPRLAVEISGVKNTQGFAIDYTAANPVVGITTISLIALVSLACVASDYQAQQKEDAEKASQYRAYLRQDRDFTIDDIHAINDHFRILQNESSPYEAITITDDGQYIEFVIRETQNKQSFLEKVSKKLSTVLSTTWETVGIASFVYWILWMAWGVLTGDFSTGIGSFGMAGFVVPLVAAAIYPLIKIGNWFRHHHGKQQEAGYALEEETPQQLQAAAELSKLLRRKAYDEQEKRLKRELEALGEPVPTTQLETEKLEGDEKIDEVVKGQWWRTAVTCVAVSITSFIGAQYAAWIITDILKVAANITLDAAGFALGFGVAILACSAVYGVYKAYEKYKDVKKYEKEISQVNQQAESLETVYQRKLGDISTLMGQIERSKNADFAWLREQKQFERSIIMGASKPIEKPETAGMTAKKVANYLLAFLGGLMSGAMIARIATVSGTAIFLPFATAVLASPYTVAIIVVCAVAYGTFKLYESYQKNKEDQAKALCEERQEKVACLKDQIKLADMQITVLKAKCNRLNPEEEKPIAGKAQDDCTASPRMFEKHRSLEAGDSPRGEDVRKEYLFAASPSPQ